MSSTDAAPAKPFTFSLRWKLLGAFAGALTVVFVFLAIWIFQYTTSTTTQRLQTQLEDSAIGGALTIDGDQFAELIATVPPVEARQPPDAPQFMQQRIRQ